MTGWAERFWECGFTRMEVYKKLVGELSLEKSDEILEVLNMQKSEANSTFAKFYQMKNMELEDYKDLKFSERRLLDQKAYERYFQSHHVDFTEIGMEFPMDRNVSLSTTIVYDSIMTFNEFYGTETHKRYLIPFLRKLKLEQIKKVSE